MKLLFGDMVLDEPTINLKGDNATSLDTLTINFRKFTKLFAEESG